MCDWRKWIYPGMAAILAITALAVLLRAGPVEADLNARLQSALADLHPWAKIGIDGRDLKITGMAPSEEAIAEAQKIAGQNRSVRTVTMEATLPPIADPWLFSVTRSADKIMLSGNVTSASAREQIKSAISAAVGAAGIEDNLTIARGEPEGSAQLSAFAIAQLAGLGEGTVALSGLDISAKGKAASVDAYESLTAALSGVLPGGGKLALAEIEPAAVSPYVLSAKKEGNALLLDGFAPSEAVRKAIVDAAALALPGGSLDHRLRIASGVPSGIDWTAASAFLVGQIANLTKGKGQISDASLSIEGVAADPDKFDAARKALGAELPPGLTLANASISQPVINPYVWSLAIKNGAVELSGFVPDRTLAERNVAQIRSAFPAGVPISDKQRLGAGALPDISGAYSAAIHLASRLAGAKADISGSSLTLSGEALTGVAANEVRDRIATGLPPNFKGTANITVAVAPAFVAPDGCQKLIAEVMNGAVLGFAPGVASIEAEFFGLLDRLALTVRKCPQARVEIASYTDSDGEDAANLKLSVERAVAVRDYLVRGGVLFSRLLPKGFGESKPVADNSTPEGKARNNRIELTVVE